MLIKLRVIAELYYLLPAFNPIKVEFFDDLNRSPYIDYSESLLFIVVMSLWSHNSAQPPQVRG